MNYLTDIALHECIHYLQERHDAKGNITRLGLCNYMDSSLPGIGLNEAAVQLMAAKALDLPFEHVKYFDITLQSNTPMYYPLECALVNQMAYVIGEDVLFDSTLHSTNTFRDMYISMTSEKEFYKIQKNIDLLTSLQENLESLFSSLEDVGLKEDFVQKVSSEIQVQKKKIKELFMETQKLILTSYFDNSIQLAYTPKALENYRNKLYLFKNLVCYSQDDNFYNEYYINKMMEIEKKYDFNPLATTSLTVVKPSLISILIRKLKLLFGLDREYEKVR